MRFLAYDPDQAYLLPPSVKDVLGREHLCFFVHEVVKGLDLREFEQESGEEGRLAYAPALMVKVWLYADALQVTSWRRLAQRVREDLAFRYLAGGAAPDHWTLNAFRTRHRRAINDLFLQVVEVARGWGWRGWAEKRKGVRRAANPSAGPSLTAEAGDWPLRLAFPSRLELPHRLQGERVPDARGRSFPACRGGSPDNLWSAPFRQLHRRCLQLTARK